MREQRAYIPTRRRSVDDASAHRVGHSVGFHPEDQPYWTEEPSQHFPYGPSHPIAPDVQHEADVLPRVPTSVRRYPSTAPATQIRVTHHHPPIRRASLLTERQTQDQQERATQPSQPASAPHGPALHWLVSMGLGMLLMLVLWLAGSTALAWVQSKGDDLTYGRPRTFQTDARVGHQDAQTPSHFLALNLHGHIIVIEFPGGDASKAKIYLGPTLAPGHDLDPVTLKFEDVNGDGKPDLIVIVAKAGVEAIFINDHGSFRPVRPSDSISF
jgi:hypothetical protein